MFPVLTQCRHVAAATQPAAKGLIMVRTFAPKHVNTAFALCADCQERLLSFLEGIQNPQGST